VQVDPIKPAFKAPGSMLLKLRYDGPLSNFAFKFNLRRYIQAEGKALRKAEEDKVGRCRLTVSKTMLKAPMISALETVI